MVVSEARLATAVGLDILKAGGNAVDAAVAVGYALAVVYPCCGNIGGGGFMTIRLADGRETVIDFRERAPLKARRDMFLDDKGKIVPGLSTRGWLAAGTPGSVMGLDLALKAYGTMSRERVMAPAIALAEGGFVVDSETADTLRYFAADFARDPDAARIFLKDGKPYGEGELLVQKELAATLRAIAREGPDGFYRGPVADEIAAASAAHGGLISKEDLAAYRAVERAPIICDYRGYRIAAPPPPSSGGVTLCETLGILEGYPLKQLGFHSAAGIHFLVEALRAAYADRNALIGDPDFVKVPLERLLSSDRAAELRARIDPSHAMKSELPALPTPKEGADTTHYSVVDAMGNGVSTTTTINGWYGARVMAGHAGFLLNNEMDDFSSKPGAPNMYGLVQAESDAIAPGKRPLSSMAPTIVTRDGKLFMVLGSPGGPRIITAVLEAVSNVIDFGMGIQEAVDAPRIHHQWLPDMVSVEPDALPPEAGQDLTEMGYHVVKQGHWAAVEAILADPATGTLEGACDPRRPGGAALGY